VRVLLALDGSPSAQAAATLVRSLSWPEGSVLHVVGVVEPPIEFATLPGVPARNTLDAAGSDELRRILDEAAEGLSSSSLAVRRTIFVGRPASVIVGAAVELEVELIVVGNRGRGPLTSMVLGSVSAEVVDHAPCPVLVVRRPDVGTILHAVDGSLSARAATTFLAGARALAGIPVEVISVAPTAERRGAFAVPTMAAGPMAEFDLRQRDAYLHAEAAAAGAAEHIRAAGTPVRWSICEGDPAHRIIEAAEAFGSGLIIVGSRGRTGLTRVLLGSVARNVLLHTPASVLIVREPLRVVVPERERAERARAVRRATAALP
jgi:nucleotide-binding universal stress UspA family protein